MTDVIIERNGKRYGFYLNDGASCVIVISDKSSMFIRKYPYRVEDKIKQIAKDVFG